MRPNDPPGDPFDDIVRELERMFDQMVGDRPRGSPVAASGGADPSAPPDVHIDVDETDERVRVVADIPGVTKDAINLHCDGTVLQITAVGTQREYDEHVRLPTRVDPASAEATYNNGILTVTFTPADSTSGSDRA